MATDSNPASKQQYENSDAYLGQPIDRRGKTLTDEQAIIFNRYNQWKSNLMCLYNHIESYALPYPARTVQFLPNAQQNISAQNQYQRYTNCPFVYPSHCTVPKQTRNHNSAQTINTNTHNNKLNNPCTEKPKMTPIYYIQNMHYFVPNRIEEQTHLFNLFHHSHTNLDLSNINSIRDSAHITGILPYDQYYHGGACVESAYDVYKLRIMPQSPHLIATRSYHEDIAIYWLDYNAVPTPLSAFKKHKNNKIRNGHGTIPERNGLSLSDDESDDDDMGNVTTNGHRHKKRKRKRRDSDEYPTKKQKLSPKNDYESGDSDEEENVMDVTVGTGDGYLIAVGQTSAKTKTGWALSFNPRHAGMFITGNSDGSIACWDLNMVDNSHCMTKMGKFKNKKHSSDPNTYMKDSKIRNRTFNDGPPFITRDKAEEYHWFEEFERYGIWNGVNTNPDVMSLDWCHSSDQIFVSSTDNGQINIWDRRASNRNSHKPQLWTWGTSHNQSILCVGWNPIQSSLIASGDKANKVRIWDIRAFNRHIVQLSQHSAPVYHVQWCPYNKYLLASSSSDASLFMYDLRRFGLGKSENNTVKEENVPRESKIKVEGMGTKDGMDSVSQLLEDLSSATIGNEYDTKCPELVFAHYGHTACIPEFDWCPSGDLTIVSTDMDGIVQTWQPPNGMLNTFGWVLHSEKQRNKIPMDENQSVFN